ncbi:hypothetical protein niasHT_014130 [Heterodera trifolii]|uniref:Uncharacterized protein n=1 Tax=Heterodera trifolii TaxID=157864 RepID=A0ABD2KX24_9BILA
MDNRQFGSTDQFEKFLTTRRQRLQRECAELKRQKLVSAFLEPKRMRNNEMALLADEVDQLKFELIIKEKNVRRLSETLDEERVQHGQQIDKMNLYAELAREREEIRHLYSQIHYLKSENGRLKETIERERVLHQMEIEDLKITQKKIIELSDSLKAADQKIAHLSDSLEAADQKIAQLSYSLKGADQKIVELTADVKDLRAAAELQVQNGAVPPVPNLDDQLPIAERFWPRSLLPFGSSIFTAALLRNIF